MKAQKSVTVKRRTEQGCGPVLEAGLWDSSRSMGQGSGSGTGTCPELAAARLAPPVPVNGTGASPPLRKGQPNLPGEADAGEAPLCPVGEWGDAGTR